MPDFKYKITATEETMCQFDLIIADLLIIDAS
jgi:hypothetical protein